MKKKLIESNDTGIKVGFKLSDGMKIYYAFKETATVKVVLIIIK